MNSGDAGTQVIRSPTVTSGRPLRNTLQSRDQVFDSIPRSLTERFHMVACGRQMGFHCPPILRVLYASHEWSTLHIHPAASGGKSEVTPTEPHGLRVKTMATGTSCTFLFQCPSLPLSPSVSISIPLLILPNPSLSLFFFLPRAHVHTLVPLLHM